jgi:hypothetical protein
MSLHNIIEGAFTCPACGQPYQHGFLIQEGDKISASLSPGDSLPWSRGQPPIGVWVTEGVGKCPHCLAYLLAVVEFDSTTFEKVVTIKADRTGAQRAHAEKSSPSIASRADVDQDAISG